MLDNYSLNNLGPVSALFDKGYIMFEKCFSSISFAYQKAQKSKLYYSSIKLQKEGILLYNYCRTLVWKDQNTLEALCLCLSL